MDTIQVYAKEVTTIESNGDYLNIILTGVNIDQIVAEFNAENILRCLDFGDIMDYVAECKKEEDYYE